MDQSQIADITEIEQLLARYAIGMTRDDIDAVVDVFTPDGTYSAFGDTYALDDFPALVRAAPKGLFLTGHAGRSSSTATPAPGCRRSASSIRPPMTCASATTRTRTGGPHRVGGCTPAP